MGIGFLGSKQIALGLGYAVTVGPSIPLVTADKGGWVNPMEYQKGLFDAEDHLRMTVLNDDEEALSIIVNIITSGIL